MQNADTRMRKIRSGSGKAETSGTGRPTRTASTKAQADSGSTKVNKTAAAPKQQEIKRKGKPVKIVESEEEDDDTEMTEGTEDTRPRTRGGTGIHGGPTRGRAAAPVIVSEDADEDEGGESETASGSGSDSDGEDAEGGHDVRSSGAGQAGRRDQRARTKSQGSNGGQDTAKVAGEKRPYSELISGLISEEGLAAAYKGLPAKRAAGSASLLSALRAQWPSWHLLLRTGFSLLLHGLGSKRELLLSFAREQLERDGAVLVFNGYVQSCSAHKIAVAAATQLTGHSCKGSSGEALMALITQEAQEWASRRVYIIINNIDGPGLRAESEQALLSRLAACPNVHIAASVDHAAAGLLWTHAMQSAFQWQYVDATTYQPYVIETMDKPSVLVGCFQQARQRGAGAVLGVLPQNAREVFALLVAHQLDDPESEGLDFKLLYRMCRERFLLSNEAALKSHLTEFRDHELLATRPASDGSGEVMYVPMKSEGLMQMQAELEALRDA